MAFVPRLPTWNTEVTCYQWDAGSSSYVAGDTVTGQIYTPYRNQANDTEVGELYFEFPVENWGAVRDPCQSGLSTPDAISFEFPAGTANILYYQVISVAPRWCNFPNQHVIAELVCLSGGLTPPAPDPCSKLVSFDFDTTSAPDDGSSAITVTVHVLNPDSSPAPGIDVTLATTSVIATIFPSATVTTDSSGDAVFTITDASAETLTCSCTITDCADPFYNATELTFYDGGGGGGGTPDCSASLFEFVPTDSAEPGGTVNVVITVKDLGGTPVSGASVTLNYSGNAGIVTIGGSPATLMEAANASSPCQMTLVRHST